MFENHTVADRFLDFWRKTGNQHFGYLYGRYTEHKDIPLGIRAEVAAIYEPPQIGTQNSLELLEDPKAEVVDEIAAKLGLRKVGWILQTSSQKTPGRVPSDIAVIRTPIF